MSNNLKVKRTDKGTGEESTVTLKHAVEKIASASFYKPDNSDRRQTRNRLKQGYRMQTISYLYKIEKQPVPN